MPSPSQRERRIVVTLERATGDRELEVEVGETICAAALRAGLQPPFSCVAGVCGECVATLDAGQVEMESNRALTPKQLARGLILTCQARPLGPGCRLRFGDWPRRA